ncbi:NAD-dependent epimerase/dehydratase family protein [Aquibacillus sp. 3ASR75-11]|uniref:NAD-dependent epimerase/dehydratase family protein n=1 Tax=Terrihalobacillus insolitus TaxID=2950438 RepID=A0A9X3WZB9_9BACI|nr:NAD-dependent epimerase/dehydratase family protein [Terrihalobacillus insolitus]MDC3414532.1 NAD-dependent epimerase/dehydratase family protein [Terrihalobacillus insolitus]MDC3426134.1 NAD-dependent epimerase/dehydratase family protein [Terrihalobacillus insolitus]
MKVLVTGGAGFIGKHVVTELLNKDYAVSIIDKRYSSCFKNQPSLSFYQEDVTTSVDWIFEKEKPDYVFHLAAQVDVHQSAVDPNLDANTNILGTINLLESCRKHQVKKFIFSSSAAVYGEPSYLGIDENHPTNPISFYGISKLTAESYIRAFASMYELNYSILRYSNVYGHRLEKQEGETNVVSIFLQRMMKNTPPIFYGDGNQTRDFIHVKDVAAANLATIKKGDNQTFNISTNTQTSLHQLVWVLNDFLGKQLQPIYYPRRMGDIQQSYMDNTKALTELNWNVNFPFEKGIQFTIEYSKENADIKNK